MVQLRPQEYFTIARGLTDHTDGGTYYVRAVVRNAKTDDLIATVDLTDQGSRRFSKPWQVPVDVQGEGFWILITTTVYEDAGLTTKSSNYGEEFNTYLVQDRVNRIADMGPLGADIDYKKVREIFKEEVKKLIPKEIDLSGIVEILKRVGNVQKTLDNLDIPKQVKEFDPAPLMTGLTRVLEAVKAIKMPDAPEPVDLTNMVDAMAELRDAVTKFIKTDKTIIEAAIKGMGGVVGQDLEKFNAGMESLKNSFEEIPYIVLSSPKKEKKDPDKSVSL